MPTAKPRLSMTLSDQQYATLRRLSAANGQPMSKIVAELFDVALPVLERTVVVLEAASRMRGQVPEALRTSLEKAEAEALAAVESNVGNLDLFVRDFEGATAQAAAQGAPQGRRARASTPVPSNHGGQVAESRRKTTTPRTIKGPKSGRRSGGRR